jgi:CubicO group peptidase (beta-lactamase class C family)
MRKGVFSCRAVIELTFLPDLRLMTMKYISLLVCLLTCTSLDAQTYFPSLDGTDWETTDPSELNWCPDKIDTLLNFLDEKNTKAFIITKNGKIVIEQYFNEHSQNDLWHWASAGKTITATLAGKAMENGLLELDDPVSQYLGTGWTSCDSTEEYQRTIYHQLSMSSSFNDFVLWWDCVQPGCFQCTGAAPGTEWHYHNGVYKRLIEVIEAATGSDRNTLTNLHMEELTGMSGFWLENLYFSTHRDMARFGILALNDFVWDGNAVLEDTDYIAALTTPSQPMNPSYGYLWWLNGQESHMFPLDQNVYPGSLIPSGPDDMYMALGADDQKIYVVPSQGLVVTRQGEAANDNLPAASDFDENLWALLSDLECDPLSFSEQKIDQKPFVFPNPSSGEINFKLDTDIEEISIFTIDGKLIRFVKADKRLNLERGIYLFTAHYRDGSLRKQKVVVQ